MAATLTYGFNPANASQPLVNYARIAWTSESDGSVSQAISLNGVILGVETNPGATAPTDNYDMTLTSAEGMDMFMGGGANRDTANSEHFVPLTTGSDGTTKMPVAVSGSLTFAIATAGSAKDGVCVIYFR